MDETHERNQSITIARMDKVRRLIAILDVRLGGDWDAAALAARRFTEDQWLGLGVLDVKIRNPRRDLSTVQAPSPRTRRMVIDALNERLRIRRAIAAKPAMEAI